MQNPKKHIRAKYKELLESAYITVYDKRVPIDNNIPNVYVIISSQTQVEINRNKCDKQLDVTTTLDLYYRQTRGINDSEVLDDLEETITDLIAPDVNTDLDFGEQFITYNTFVENPVDLPQETQTETLHHRVLRFRHIIGGYAPETRLFFRFGYSSTDPTTLAVSNEFRYQYHDEFNSGTETLPLSFRAQANGNYWVIEGAYGQAQLTDWISTEFNYGTFADLVFKEPIFANNRYYYITRTNNNYLQTSYETITLS